MDILSVLPYIITGLVVIGAVIFLERDRRRSKADDERFYARQSEINQKWEYVFQLWREQREQEECEREEWRQERAEWQREREQWQRERNEASRLA